MIKRTIDLKQVAVLFLLVCSVPLQAQQALSDEGQNLINAFWQANSERDLTDASNKLIELTDTPMELFAWMKQGPLFDSSAPTGVVEQTRVDSQSIEFPYVFLIPSSYDSKRAYPVEFNLHGGVGRPKREPGESLWRNGYDNLKKEDRIVVVPAAWREAYWWQSMQADNLPAILKRLKQEYNVDENRVTLSGVSDGGTGAYFFAFKQPTEWAAFFPYIGHPGVLRNANSGGGYSLFFENLMNKPMYIVNGEVDRLYPADSVKPFIDILIQSGVTHIWKVIEDGGHNTQWLPEETPLIESFKAANPRDPFPDEIQWVADRTDRYNRNHWVQIDQRSAEDTPAIIKVAREGNVFEVDSLGVGKFTLLLNPDEVDFGQAVTVNVNGETLHNGEVIADSETLLKWAAKDHDRTLLILAELSIEIPAA